MDLTNQDPHIAAILREKFVFHRARAPAAGPTDMF